MNRNSYFVLIKIDNESRPRARFLRLVPQIPEDRFELTSGLVALLALLCELDTENLHRPNEFRRIKNLEPA